MEFAKRLLELVIVTFFGAAVPVFVSGGFDKAAISAAASAGLAALYGLLTKKVGDPAKPGVSK